MTVWKLPKVRKMRGPDVFSEKRVKEFKNKYQKLGRIWVDGEFWFAEVKREFTNAEDKIAEFLRDKRNILREKGIPSYIAQSVSRNFAILRVTEIQKIVKSNNEFAVFLRDYFEREMI